MLLQRTLTLGLATGLSLVSAITASAYEVRLVATSTAVSEAAEAPHLFYKPALGERSVRQIHLYHPFLEYPIKPCGMGADASKGLRVDSARPYVEAHCPKLLYAHGRDEVREVKVQGLDVRIIPSCGRDALEITFESYSGFRPPLFWSTMGRPGKSTFVAPESLRVARIPFALPKMVRTPEGVVGPTWRVFRYPTGPGGMYIVEVRGRIDFESPDPDKSGPSGVRTWQGVFLVGPDRAVALTPPNPMDTHYFGGTDFDFGGLLDVDGDGQLDILVGEWPTLILRRTRIGFSGHSFPYVPPGGC